MKQEEKSVKDAPISTEGVRQIQLQEMLSPEMKPPWQKRRYDEELERQIRLLLISSYNPAGVKTTWHCSQCGFSCELQYSVKQHIETHITTVVHQCTSPKNTEDKECSESTHEPEARVEAPSKLC